MSSNSGRHVIYSRLGSAVDGHKDDNLALIAGGVAFFGVLSLAPALAAIVSIYGLVAAPDDVARHVDALGGALPDEVRRLLLDQLSQIARSSGSRLGIQVAIGIALALWAASSAMKHLMVAFSAIYDEQETRGYLKLRLTALVVTGGPTARRRAGEPRRAVAGQLPTPSSDRCR